MKFAKIISQSAIELGNSSVQIYNVDGYIHFIDSNSPSGKTISEIVTASRLTPIDGYTVVNWKLNESTAPYANSGVGAAANLTVKSNLPTGVIAGPFGNCVDLGGNGVLTKDDTSVGEISNNLTISFWYYCRQFASSNAPPLIMKKYQTGDTWSTPYTSLTVENTASSLGLWSVGLTVSGTRTYCVATGGTTGTFQLPLFQWTLLAATYDNSFLRIYINGKLANSAALTGNLDWGSHGPWRIGYATDNHCFRISDVRVESTVRSQQYLEDYYRKGIGWTI